MNIKLTNHWPERHWRWNSRMS